MNLVEAINEAWAWAIPTAVEVEAVNSFGNVIVRCANGACYRIVPEELQASQLPSGGLAEALKQAEFRRDWEMAALVNVATRQVGANIGGRCYGFALWPALGGEYKAENMASKDLVEWLRVSGDVGRQVAQLPEGAKVQITING